MEFLVSFWMLKKKFPKCCSWDRRLRMETSVRFLTMMPQSTNAINIYSPWHSCFILVYVSVGHHHPPRILIFFFVRQLKLFVKLSTSFITTNKYTSGSVTHILKRAIILHRIGQECIEWNKVTLVIDRLQCILSEHKINMTGKTVIHIAKSTDPSDDGEQKYRYV